MITKPLIILSLVYNLVFFNLSAGKIDQRLADFYAKEDYSAAKAENQTTIIPTLRSQPTINSASPKSYANARQYLLVDFETGDILAANNSSKHVPIASTTKIMTAVVALENYNLDDVVTISTEATTQPGADSYLRMGEKISVLELLYCMLVKSGNDSAYAIALFMDKSGNNDSKPFVEKMNQKAKELNMNDTEYHDSAGLDTSGYSSAEDLATITRYALLNPIFRQIVATPEYVATNIDKTIFHQLTNSNRLVNEYHYPGAIGVKTGYMPEAGHCLVGAAERDGHTLIAVVLSTYVDSATASVDEAKKLLDWGFTNVVWPS